MIKLESLPKDEQKYICNHISLRDARLYFQKYPKKFNEIKPGFRPEKLSDSDTNQILIKYLKYPFINLFLEKTVADWLSHIEEERDRLISEGYSEEEALIRAVTDSVFCDNCELYFKLSDAKVSDAYVRLFQESMRLLANADEYNVKDSSELTTNSNQEVIDDISSRLTECEEKLAKSQELEKKLREDLASLNQKSEAKDREIAEYIKQIESAKSYQDEMQSELDYYRRLNNYSDAEVIQEEYDQYQHVSVGLVRFGFDNRPFINRLADVINGEIVPFSKDETKPVYFENRVKIYCDEGTDEENHIGIWSWSSFQRDNDPEKDRVESKYWRYSSITEVVELPQCNSLSEIAEILSDWSDKSYVVDKVLFVYKTQTGSIEGLLCSPGSLEQKGNKVRLSATAFMLPHYVISTADVITMAGKRFYRKLSLGVPQSVYRVRNPYDVVKRMLLDRVTISSLREMDLSKKEAQKCKSFLESIPTKTLIEEFADAYACSEKEAQEYVNGFIEHVDTYLSEDDLDLKIVSKALSRNPELVDLCKNMLLEDWKAENEESLEAAKNQLSSIESLQKEREDDIEKIEARKVSLLSEIDGLQEKIEETKKLAGSVEKETSERIVQAQNNVAGFIANMAFVKPAGATELTQDIVAPNSWSILTSSMNYVEGTEVDDIDSFEEELTENLVRIGYAEIAAVEMAQGISFSICSRLPIVCKENAVSISQCLACTLGGGTLTEVFVSYQSTVIGSLLKLINDNKSDSKSVYLIHGVFDGYNNTLFNEIANLSQKTAPGTVLIISLEGTTPNMLSSSIWNRAIYIDGDEGLLDLVDAPVHALNIQLDFKREIDEDEYRMKKREFQPFLSLLSNIQISYYSKYLASYNVDLNNSSTVLDQLIVTSSSSGKEEELRALFQEKGIDNGANRIEGHLKMN